MLGSREILALLNMFAIASENLNGAREMVSESQNSLLAAETLRREMEESHLRILEQIDDALRNLPDKDTAEIFLKLIKTVGRQHVSVQLIEQISFGNVGFWKAVAKSLLTERDRSIS